MGGYEGEQGSFTVSGRLLGPKSIIVFVKGSLRKKKNVTVDEEGAVKRAPAMKFHGPDNVRARKIPSFTGFLISSPTAAFIFSDMLITSGSTITLCGCFEFCWLCVKFNRGLSRTHQSGLCFGRERIFWEKENFPFLSCALLTFSRICHRHFLVTCLSEICSRVRGKWVEEISLCVWRKPFLVDQTCPSNLEQNWPLLSCGLHIHLEPNR